MSPNEESKEVRAQTNRSKPNQRIIQAGPGVLMFRLRKRWALTTRQSMLKSGRTLSTDFQISMHTNINVHQHSCRRAQTQKAMEQK